MKKFVFLILSLCSLLALCLCADRQHVAERLTAAEQFMGGGRPDSALYALQSIDPALIHRASQQNHYYLLLAQAKDKCYIDETDDSVLLQVIDYYRRSADKEKLFKAYYYLGRTYQNAFRYSDAMYYYIEAEQISGQLNDELQKGLLYAHIGQLHEQMMNLPSALAAYEQAETYYRRAGSIQHIHYATLDKGRVAFRMKDYATAVEFLSEVMELSYQEGLDSVAAFAFDMLCLTYEATSDFQALDELLASDYSQIDTASMILNLTKAYKYARDNEESKMAGAMRSAWDNAVYPTDTATIYHREYLVSKQLGNYEDALSAHEKLLVVQDSIVRVSLQNSLEQTRADYFETKLSYARYQARIRMIIAILLIMVLLLALCLLAVYFRAMIKRKDRQIEDYMAIAADMRTIEDAVAKLFSKQYKLLDKLSVVYYETHGSNRDKEAIYKQVKAEIERFCNDKKFLAELESIVDSHRGGVMRKVRNGFTQWTEMDFRLLCFFYAGFSAKAISVFTGDSTGNIYVKKSRLKKEIQAKLSDIEII